MRSRAFVVLLIGLVIAAGAASDDAAKKEMKQLEGTWKVTAFENNGNRAAGETVARWKIIIKQDKYKVILGDREFEEGTFTLDPTKKPKSVDTKPETGPSKGETRLGIYELNGDDGKVCFVEAGKKGRPTEFTAETDSGRYLWILKREKP